MFKRNITFEDYDGIEQTEAFYFNFTKAELLELEVNYEGGLTATLDKIIAAKDHKSLVEEFKRIVLLAYGERSEDGKRFIKNEQLREEFSQTAAYSALFMELAMDSKKASEFINNTMPKDLAEAAKAEVLKAELAGKYGITPANAVPETTTEAPPETAPETPAIDPPPAA